MYNGVATACDSCLKPLDGIVGTAKVRKQYLTVRGIICLKVWDKDGIDHYVYAHRDANEALRTFNHFCNGKCLSDWMDVKIYLKAQYHDKKGLLPVEYLPEGAEVPEGGVRTGTNKKPAAPGVDPKFKPVDNPKDAGPFFDNKGIYD